MAISEPDRQVLHDLEKGLLADDRRASFALVRRRTARLLLALTGIVTGLLVLFIGLRLQNTVGTCLGVAGSLGLVASAWLGIRNTNPWLKSQLKSAQVGIPK
jgi:hypothetical protein